MKREFTARTLRNRILTILDAAEEMDGVHMVEDEGIQHDPAIAVTVEGKEFIVIVYERRVYG